MGQVIENIDTAILMEEGSISYDEMPIGIIHSFLFKFFKPGVDIEKEMKSIQVDFNCQYEEKDSIGRRYRRQDAIGTPFCITVDHQTLKDNTITLRDRDSMNQERIDVNKLHSFIYEKTNIAKYLI